MKRFLLLAAWAAVFIASALYLIEPTRMSWAADSFTVTAVADTEADYGAGWPYSFKVIKAAWTASAIAQKADGTIPAIKGRLVQVVTDPGSTAPADNYDITLKDATGVDVTGGALANRDTANTETVIPLAGSLAMPQGRFVYGPLTVSFTELANANCDGVIYLYFEE